ncbi:OmcA/MtrC family decaheme c-type cytochrome [Anaeromyxobacter terrae]|uniref:OmcA/MtrC family decaheme c-type cytochrome n=1 Tax=Anaeromyxobacter terrae TaxID=2925406 RepID=UPI001F57885C|nr:OmcA/MtrC family decaheme c-type cytochrome [Anaeromyxobacter sp. SG22]
MSRRFTKSAFAAAVTFALLGACQQAPRLGPAAGAPPPKGPRIEIAAATVDAAQRVAVTFRASRDGRPLGLEAARALQPAWTLASLGKEPVTGLPAWRSLVLTGAETLVSLPVAGPGTPDGAVLLGTRQPGAETEGTWAEQGGGVYTYTFATVIPAGYDPAETLRVGVFLRGVPGTALTTATIDFVPNHGPLSGRELVVDAACAACHGTLRAHGGSRTGTRICVTCHTYQHADGQTVDPAARADATPDTNPNPLELGRLVHRIHRGKTLPTLYVSSSALAAPQPYGDVKPPLPFLTGRNKLPTDMTLVGRRFAVVGELSRERVFGAIATRSDNGQPAKMLAAGITFPRDYRSCEACHTTDAAQVAAIDTEISRRTCQGCHPDVWFQPAVAPDLEAKPPDVFHLAHPGGPQADDSRCNECHVPTTANPNVRVPMKEAHVPPYRHARYSKPTVEIVSVTNLTPGLAPTVVFKVSDRNGAIRDLANPAPASDGNVPASNVPRAVSRLTIYLAGPAAPDFRTLGTSVLPLSEIVVGDPADPTKPVPTSDAEGRFTFTFPDTDKIPEGSDGTWLVGIEARRSNLPVGVTGATAPFWDDAAKRLVWPYTGETVTEVADNALAWVDTSTGALGSGAPAPRRTIVDLQKCNACHLRLSYHGGVRNQTAYCVICHAPDKTDWRSRPKDAPGNTNLAATYDDVEERSLHFKVIIHRIHTGGRTGPAELTKPLASYGGPKFRDMGEFPNDLARCTLCHLEGTYRLESIPSNAAATIANETGTILHAASTAHSPDEPAKPALTAACTGCHGTAYSAFHVARYTSDGKEQCLSCHGVNGAQAVDKVHTLPLPVPQ